MHLSAAKEVIDVIRTAQGRRAAARRADEDPDIAGEIWVEVDVPFVNELSLMLLVAVWHQLERELIWLAALVTDDGNDIDDLKQYSKNVKTARERFRRPGGWKDITSKLNLKACAEWNSMEMLHHLANCYKHDPSGKPDEKLLTDLALDATEIEKYASIPESHRFREGLIAFLNLEKDADFSDIAEELLNRVAGFLTDVRTKAPLRHILDRRVPFLSLDFYGC